MPEIRTKFKNTLNALLNAFPRSGGWAYHKRHFLNRHRWQNFADHLQTQVFDPLAKQSLVKRPLLLVGPSAGYSLPESFLSKFERVDAIDIDPLSPALWKFHHVTPVSTWKTDNYFLYEDAYSRLRTNYPGHFILFCNVLGQLPYSQDFSEEHALAWKDDFEKLLAPWCSYHDIYSLHGHAKLLSQFESDFVSSTSRQELRLSLRPWLDRLEVLDHRSQEFVPELKARAFVLWRFSKNSLHIVEAVSNT